MDEDWITTNEACKISGYTSRHIRRLLESELVEGKRWGRDWQVSKTSLLDYMKRTENKGEKRGPKPKSEQTNDMI